MAAKTYLTTMNLFCWDVWYLIMNLFYLIELWSVGCFESFRGEGRM